ncbi:MAG: triose-phosphate isomerase [Candidatus Latescibacteria bacterium]|nr:triose-phosphate isomerase [Candidatus Latescibacterota bacterium]
MRRFLVAGNWKMHKTLDEARQLVADLLPLVEPACGGRDVVLCPPAPYLALLGQLLENSPVALGAQTMHWEEEGAYTGEVAAGMILTSGGAYVILGHSERRQYFGETDESVKRKVKAALAARLVPIVCVGESLEQRLAGQVEEIVIGQTAAALADIDAGEMGPVVLAYEPVWAIGTGQTATAEQAEEVHAMIRAFLQQRFGQAVADQTRIQYGGSVKADNAAELFAQPNIDGGLIGGAALKAADFAAIVQAAG